MLAHMDIISVNCPHTPATYHPAVGAAPQAVPPARDPRQQRARRDRRLGGIDPIARDPARSPAPASTCFEHEPAVDPRLRALDNVVLLPPP